MPRGLAGLVMPGRAGCARGVLPGGAGAELPGRIGSSGWIGYPLGSRIHPGGHFHPVIRRALGREGHRGGKGEQGRGGVRGSRGPGVRGRGGRFEGAGGRRPRPGGSRGPVIPGGPDLPRYLTGAPALPAGPCAPEAAASRTGRPGPRRRVTPGPWPRSPDGVLSWPDHWGIYQRPLYQVERHVH